MMDFPSRKNLPDKCVTLLAVKQFREGVTLCSPRLKAQPHDVPCAAEEPMVCRLSAGGNRIRTIGPAEKETAVERGPAADHRRLVRRPVLNDPVQLIGPASPLR